MASDFLGEVIVAEHEIHCVAVGGQAADAVTERSHQIVEVVVQHVGQDRAFQVAPQSLDQVQARAVGGSQ